MDSVSPAISSASPRSDNLNIVRTHLGFYTLDQAIDLSRITKTIPACMACTVLRPITFSAFQALREEAWKRAVQEPPWQCQYQAQSLRQDNCLPHRCNQTSSPYRNPPQSAGPVLLDGRYCIHNPISANLARVFIPQIKSGFDAWSYDQGRLANIFIAHLLDHTHKGGTTEETITPSIWLTSILDI